MIIDQTQKHSVIKQYAGGKALSLYQMQQMGLNVPSWFCIDSRFFQKKISPYFEDIIQLSKKSQFDKIEQVILNIPFSKDEIHNINQHKFGSNAVRSSANLEDGVEASFAGIYESFLYIEDNLDKYIKKCWLSVFSEHHLEYIKQKGIKLDQIKMSVVIQQMIDPTVSGIYFQSNPNGNLNEKVIVAGYGVGQGVVDGVVETDTYKINTISKGIEKEIVLKTKQTKRNTTQDKNEVEVLKVELEKQSIPTLEDSQVNHIVENAKNYTDNENLFFDFEWAISNNELFFLQARPITTVSQNKKVYFYDNSNIIENYPGISLPLTASSLKRLYGENLKSLMLYLGYFKSEVKKFNSIIYNSVEDFDGRFYYVVNHWYALLGTVPFINRFLKKSWNSMIGVQKADVLYIPKINFFKQLLMGTRVIPKILKHTFFPRKCQEDYQVNYLEFEKNYGNIDLKELSSKEMLEQLKLAEDKYFSFACKALLNDLVVSLHLKICSILVNNDLSIISSQTESDPEVESYKLVLSTNQLAKYLHNRPQTQSFILETPDIKKLEVFDPEFFKLVTTHLNKYGSRTIEEMKYETPSLAEDPNKFLRFLAEPIILNEHSENEKNDLSKKMSFFKRVFFKYFIHLYRESIRFRELSRFNRVRVKTFTRLTFLELGSRLVNLKIIDEREDIFYFNESELPVIITELTCQREKVQKLKKYYKKSTEREYPNSFLLNSEFDISHYQSSLPSTDTQLRGAGCCPGEVEEECIVLDAPNIDADVEGKILVTDSTDPGWVFLMMKAKGLIVTRGNILSHAAIIGRELKIPTIINIPNATKVLKTGMRLHMDGASGEVKIIECKFSPKKRTLK